jgi:transposase
VSHYRLHGIDGLRPKRSTYSEQFKLKVLSHQDREQLSSRQVAAIYDIRNPNQVVVWRRKLDEGGVEALGNREQEHPKYEERPTLPSATKHIHHRFGAGACAKRTSNYALRWPT